MSTSGGRRSLDELRPGLDDWCRTRSPHPCGIAALQHAAAGLSNETIIATLDDGMRLVVRPEPLAPTFPDAALANQADLINRLAAIGVAVAAPSVVEADPTWIGTGFMVMPFIVGHIPSSTSVFDPWLCDVEPAVARATHDAMADTLAALHRHDPAVFSDLVPATRPEPRDDVAHWRRYLDWAAEGAPPPRFVAVLDHCLATAPIPTAVPSLCWGDARLENLVFDEHRHVVAMLDWEMASIGAAESDLGWYLGLEAVLRELTGGTTVPGFRSDGDFVARYEAALGRRVEHLGWHRTFAVARSMCVNVRQATLAAAAGVDYLLPADETNPLLGIVERWIEAANDESTVE